MSARSLHGLPSCARSCGATSAPSERPSWAALLSLLGPSDMGTPSLVASTGSPRRAFGPDGAVYAREPLKFSATPMEGNRVYQVTHS